MSCGICLELLRYPVTLGCGHSVCKPCILSAQRGGSGVNVLCPMCRAPSHFAAESAVAVNEALQRSVDVLRGDVAAKVPCQRCETTEATVDCADCSAKFCSSCCDLVHVGRLRSHRLEYSDAAVTGAHRPPVCPERGHDDYRLDLYCTDCNALLCVLCSQTASTHRAHNVVPVRQAAEVERVKLQRTLDAADRFRAELRDVSRALDSAVDDAERSTSSELEAFSRTITELIDALTQKRAQVTAEAQRRHKEETLKVRRAKEQVVNLASKLNDTVTVCQRAIANNAHIDIITGRVEMERQLGTSAPVVVPQMRPPQVHFAHYTDMMTAIDAISLDRQAAPIEQMPSAVLEASTIFQQRGFRFCKSTYNEVQLLHRGYSAVSAGKTWETVMCDALLSTGVHFFEVKLDRYDPSNGHNVIIGLVFDGGFELCEVIGEDTNSVGFNCGRGTKCVNGDFMVEYGTACAAGDVVGVKIDYNSGDVDYYRNGVSLGTAFTGLSRPCYAAVSLINSQQVSLMFPATVPS